MPEQLVSSQRLGLAVTADNLSGDFPERSRLVDGSFTGEVAKLELQLFKRLRLNLLVGRALQRGTPLTLILPNHVFRHVAESNCKSIR
jgi:hypothetical protein